MTGFLNADGSLLVGALGSLASPGQALKVDALGNLRVAGSEAAATYEGKSFIATTSLQVSAADANNYPLSIFNPATTKNILIHDIHASAGTAVANSITMLTKFTTSNPAYGSAAVVSNAKAGGPASAIASSCTYTLTSQSIAGPYAMLEVSASSITLLRCGATILLPAGINSGLTIFLQTYAAGYFDITVRWIEF